MFCNNESKILLKHKELFINKKIFFSGNIQDNIVYFLNNKNNKIHIQQIHNENIIDNFLKKNICFRSLPKQQFISNCTIIIFFWVRNKIESKFQLMHLLSIMNIHQQLFIIGRKKFGIHSVKKILTNYVILKKMDCKKQCILYVCKKVKNNSFIFKQFVKKYIFNNILINTLPGLFDYKGIDQGSILMISTFQEYKLSGKILDIGSGSGILSIILKKNFPKNQITLIDNNSTALLCSKYNLHKNHIVGKVLYSNIYSKINKKFNAIISNPPTHYGIYNNNNIIYKIIIKAKNFLYKNGKLRIVVHSYISCKDILSKIFGNYKIIKTKNHFNVYESILK